jgi:single-strand DNA-binding protein
MGCKIFLQPIRFKVPTKMTSALYSDKSDKFHYFTFFTLQINYVLSIRTKFQNLFGGITMPALNRVQLIGRLGKDPESKFTPTGKKVVHFSVAISNRWKNKEGQSQEYTEWVNVEAWGRLGEVCQEYLKKGSLVFVEGRLKTDRYENNGETKFYTKVITQLPPSLSDRRIGFAFCQKASEA